MALGLVMGQYLLPVARPTEKITVEKGREKKKGMAKKEGVVKS